ncbi:MAG: hypothetical protein R3D55_12320 [Chloroflexota bacterium]
MAGVDWSAGGVWWGGETAVSLPNESFGGNLYFILQEPRRQALMHYDVAADRVTPCLRCQ